MVDKDAHYLMNKGGVYYFTRHVPSDLQRHYQKPRIVMCLKTRSKNAALKASHSLACELEEHWYILKRREIKQHLAKVFGDGQFSLGGHVETKAIGQQVTAALNLWRTKYYQSLKIHFKLDDPKDQTIWSDQLA